LQVGAPLPERWRKYLRVAREMPGFLQTAVRGGVDSPSMQLPDEAKDLIRSGALGHLVTVAPGGAPQVTCVWVGVDGDDLLTAHLNPHQRKLENVRHDPRVAISFEGTTIHPPGLREYLVVHGHATIEEGGAPELLQELAHVHLGPDVRFPPMDEPPPGVRMRIAVERLGGVGPWIS
jgi:PPOX class probable F420-dependent enzyme